mgnify:CR=1 FL=1
MNISLKSKHALVGGSSKGLGNAVAKQLALSGAKVTLVARSNDLLENTISELNKLTDCNHEYIICDYNDHEEYTKIMGDYLENNTIDIRAHPSLVKLDSYLANLKGVRNASENLQGVSVLTPLVINERLSNDLNCKIYLKREDLQQVRSFKIRGAFNKIRSIDSDYLKNKTLVCASAGNHAQGFAYSCNKLKISGKIYMPVTTPKQKIERVKIFGGEYVEIILIGDNFDDAQYEAQKQNTDKDLFVHAFDDVNVIEGQGTIGLEILDQVDKHFDYLKKIY